MTTHTLFGRLLALVLAIMLTAPSMVWADDAAAAAAEYYNQATVAYQQGDYQKAADLLDLAFGANPDLVYKYNRILALQALGDYDTALAELNTMYGPMKADGQNRFDDVEQIKASIEAAITARNDAKPVDPPPDETPDPVAPPPKKGPNYLAIGLIGGGGALLGTGIIFVSGLTVGPGVRGCLGLWGNDPNCDDYLAEFEGEITTNSEARQEAERVQNTHGVVGITLLAAGAITAAVGVVLLVLDSGDKEAEPATAGLDSLLVTPYFTQDGAGAAMQLRF